jgi:RNA polymerase sigma-70 factor (ECF subfamily)
VIYLLFTSGHTAPSGDSLQRTELLDESLHVARMLRALMPDESEVAGLLALLLVNDARRETRLGVNGEPLRLEEQDRSLWDRAAIDEAQELISVALRRPGRGRYVLQAAIALLYVEAPSFDETDWPRILRLYDELLLVWPSPVVALNRAVVVWKSHGPEVALALIAELAGDERLAHYHYLYAVKAELLSQLGRTSQAADAYRRAAELSSNVVERKFLDARAAEAALL